MGVCPESTRGHTQAFASQELSALWRGEINVKNRPGKTGAACK